MPQAPLDVNWEAVRAHAVTHGIRPTAEHYGISVGTLFARSSREGWLKPATQPPTQSLPATLKPKASMACKPHEAARNALETLGNESRLHLAKAGNKLSRRFSGMSAEKLETRTQPLKDTAQVLEKVHGWNQQAGAAALVSISIDTGSHAPTAPVIDVSDV